MKPTYTRAHPPGSLMEAAARLEILKDINYPDKETEKLLRREFGFLKYWYTRKTLLDDLAEKDIIYENILKRPEKPYSAGNQPIDVTTALKAVENTKNTCNQYRIILESIQKVRWHIRTYRFSENAYKEIYGSISNVQRTYIDEKKYLLSWLRSNPGLTTELDPENPATHADILLSILTRLLQEGVQLLPEEIKAFRKVKDHSLIFK